ncbi:M23 family metallopeptidase [Oscillospiraceae bacterium PP1C4]
MVRQRTQPTRRYASSRYSQKKGEGDPYLFMLIVQLSISALLVLLTFVVISLKPPFLDELKAYYQTMISTKKIDLPIGAALSSYSQQYDELKDSAADATADFISSLLAPKTNKTDEKVQTKEKSVSTEEKQASGNQLTGAGGWMGVGDSDGRTAPASCVFSPMILSIRLETPTSGKVTSGFGYREHPLTESDDFHRGVDIAAVAGSGIYAPLPGRVSEVDSSAIYGNYITLDHGNGLMTTYCHCDTIVAGIGANLRKGELLATVGSTGISTGPHVHLEISKNGTYFNPAWVLEGMNNDGI